MLFCVSCATRIRLLRSLHFDLNENSRKQHICVVQLTQNRTKKLMRNIWNLWLFWAHFETLLFLSIEKAEKQKTQKDAFAFIWNDLLSGRNSFRYRIDHICDYSFLQKCLQTKDKDFNINSNIFYQLLQDQTIWAKLFSLIL